MRCAYFDCFNGAAGDMILAAMIDAGLPADFLPALVEKLRLPGVEVAIRKVQRRGLAATHVDVQVAPSQKRGHRHLPQILRIIEAATLPERVARRATEAFMRLARAEAAIHGTSIEKVHFHEVGAADAIVDIVGACAGVERLGLQRITCSPVPVGSGTVTCEHGVLPVPAPATAELLRGVPLAASDEPGELITPTGAALLTTLAESFGPLPELRIGAIGYGAGTREGHTRANVMRLILGDLDAQDSPETDQVVQVETQVDDATGQALAFAAERLLEAGALDAYFVPILMKKGRPGHLLTVLARPADVDVIERVIFAETTTLGVRRHMVTRRKLPREHVVVTTPFGEVRVKVARHTEGQARAWPEYDDCAAAARSHGVPLADVQKAALQAFAERGG
jgi:uncharacterized protein (TIGR00299 family) protein